MTPSAFFDLASGTVRFWVDVDQGSVGAIVSKETLHYRYRPDRLDDVALETYSAHMAALHAAVRLRFRAGAREPVILRSADICPQPP